LIKKIKNLEISLNLITLIFSLLCFFTEPGIIKRNSKDEEIDNLEQKYTNEKLEIFNNNQNNNHNHNYSQIETNSNLSKNENNLNIFMPSILK